MKFTSKILTALIAISIIVLTLTNCALFEDGQSSVKYIVEGELYAAESVFKYEEIKLPKDPTRSGFDFAGWYYDEPEYTMEFDPKALTGFIEAKEIIVYAKWVPHSHNVEGTLSIKPDGKLEFIGQCTVASCGESFHEPDAKATLTETTASCTLTGRTTYTYKFEGKTFETFVDVPKTEHKLNGEYISKLVNHMGQLSVDTKGVSPRSDVSALPCSSASFDAVYICDVCKCAIDIQAVKQHTYTDIELKQFDPGEKEYYKLYAECSREGCEFVLDQVAEDKLIKDQPVIIATCGTSGTKKVTYTNSTPSFVFGELTVIGTAIVPATGKHIMSNRPDKFADQYALADGTFEYYYKDGTLLFDTNFANVNISALDCGDCFQGYYRCITCHPDNNIISVTIFKNHKYKVLESEAATCTSSGYSKEQCENCKQIDTFILDQKAHVYEYTLNPVADGDTNIYNDSLAVTASCKNCTDVVEIAVYEKEHSKLTYAKTVPTCGTDGEYKVTALYDKLDNTKNAKVYYTYILPATGKHILNGKVASDVYANKDGTYDLTVEGIRLCVSNDPVYLCSYANGKTQAGYFICEYCQSKNVESIVYVDVFVNHVKGLPGDDYMGGWKVAVNATCHSAGMLTLDKCDTCGTSADSETYKELIPATDKHTYAYKLEWQGFSEHFKLITYCSFNGCGYSTSAVVQPTKTLFKTATCSEKGIYRYSYKVPGTSTTVYYDMEFSNTNCHKLNGQYVQIDDHTTLSSKTPGIVFPEGFDISNYKKGDIVRAGFVCPDCKQYVAVDVIIE